MKGRNLSQKLAENAKCLKLRPEGFGEELVKIGFAIEGMYGTPGEGGMCPIPYSQARLTLTANQVSNEPCMLITNRHESAMRLVVGPAQHSKILTTAKVRGTFSLIRSS